MLQNKICLHEPPDVASSLFGFVHKICFTKVTSHYTFHYAKVGLVTLVDFLALTFFSAGIHAEPIRLQDGQLLRNIDHNYLS